MRLAQARVQCERPPHDASGAATALPASAPRPQPHPPGENALPSEAGMLALIQAALREISTSTRIVAR
jgi:hypothetical protein